MELKKINPFYWLNKGKRKLMSKYVKRFYDKNGGQIAYCYYDEKSEKVIDPIYPRSETDVEVEFWYLFTNDVMDVIVYIITCPFKLIEYLISLIVYLITYPFKLIRKNVMGIKTWNEKNTQ